MVKFREWTGPNNPDDEGDGDIPDLLRQLGAAPGFPLSHTELVQFLRQSGVVPPWVPDNAVHVDAFRPSTGAVHHIAPGYTGTRHIGDDDQGHHGEWHLDDIFPHTEFDDPPHGKTPEEYKAMLLGTLAEAANLEEFTLWLASGLGTDMVISHDVPAEMAMQACQDFAAKIYREYRENA